PPASRTRARARPLGMPLSQREDEDRTASDGCPALHPVPRAEPISFTHCNPPDKRRQPRQTAHEAPFACGASSFPTVSSVFLVSSDRRSGTLSSFSALLRSRRNFGASAPNAVFRFLARCFLAAPRLRQPLVCTS